MARMYAESAYRVVNFLTVIGEGDSLFDARGYQIKTSICKCVCGIIKTIRDRHIKSNAIKSCGCMLGKSHEGIKFGQSKYTWPVMSHRKENQAYRDMIRRCYDKDYKHYHNYGGRGIIVCPNWYALDTGWDAFMGDMHNKYFEGGELDRIDNNGNYCVENCDYVTIIEQANNRRTNLLLTIGGVTMDGIEWSRHVGTNPKTIYTRHSRGWPDHECVYGRTR